MSNPHDDLNHLIDAAQTGTPTNAQPQSSEQQLTLDLLRLVDDIEPPAELDQRVDRISNDAKQTKGPHDMHHQFPSNRPRLFAYSTAAAAILVVLTLTVPPLRTFAQDLLASLFNQAASDVIPFETPIEIDLRPTPSANAQVAIPGTLDEVQADFVVKVPGYVPAGYELTDVSNPAPGMVSLAYERDGYALLISQSLLEDAPEFEVGASAAIIPVQIGAVTGQYVEGIWKVDMETNGDQGIVRQREWTTEIAYEQMRWIEDGIVYWMHSVVGTGTDLTLDEWVAIAESLQ